MNFYRKLIMVFSIIALLTFMSSFSLISCAYNGSVLEESPVGSSADVPGADSTNIIYEFPDLPVPVELERVDDRTLMIKTSSFQGGVLVFKGRITTDSLVEFFAESMPKHGWMLEGTLKAKRSFLAFSKGNNSYCLIQIYEKSMGFKTEVQVWISRPLVHG